MSEVITVIVLGIVAILFFAVGVLYVHITKKSAKASHTAFNKQEYVKQNRAEFGVENRGTSMDGQKIFTVSPSDIGL